MEKIIFTDLDGSLLDHDNYSFEQAKKALKITKEKRVPILICTSKTRAEIKYWREKLENNDPFISENGGGIFIPKNYFSFDFLYSRKDSNYFIIDLGVNYSRLVQTLNSLKKEFDIRSFSDMAAGEIADDANLSLSQAKLAMKREYDLPFKILNDEQERDIIDELKKRGLKITKGGRYYHLMGDNDKGEAVKILSELMERKFGEIYTIGIGDSENDFPMLEVVDSPYIVMKKDGSYSSSDYTLAGGIGPGGWQKAIEIEMEK